MSAGALEKEFEIFFENLKKHNLSTAEMMEICKSLKNYNRWKNLKIYLIIIITIMSLYMLIAWCNWFNWFISAVGRLILIELLPFWNWPSLYNSKCLIDRVATDGSAQQSFKTISKYETERENCLLCENIDYIPIASNVSFSYLEHNFLERALPVVITDSHGAIDPEEFYSSIFLKSPDLLKSSPCDISTNLMLNKLFNLELALQKSWQSLYSPNEKWFLQLRNCQFKAVKSSRILMQRPYFYPVHLEPYYSSWLLLANNYDSSKYQEIYVQGLIIIKQLWGSMKLALKPKDPCWQCPRLSMYLRAGESLVFSTDLWLLEYSFQQQSAEDSLVHIATIMEIDWNY